jgi:DNA modification methylase
MQTLRIEYVAIDELRPAERNARAHSPKQLHQLAAAIREFKFTNPILIDHDNRVVAGHARLEAARMVGLPTVPVIRIEHLSDEQKRALALADNKIGLNSSWDLDVLRAELKELSTGDIPFDVEITGFDTAEIDLVIDGPSLDEVHPWDDIPELEMQAVSQPDDHWILGDHHLLCGDALKARSYSELMGDEKARTVFADVPFNVPIQGHVGGLGSIKHREFAMASGEMSESEFTQFLNTAFTGMAGVSVDGAIHFICMDWRHVGEVLAAGNPVYSELKNICVWNKDNGGMGSFYRSKHELVFVFKVGTAAHVNTIELGRSGRYRTNVWDYAGVNTLRPGRREELEMHPTVKPTALVMDAIKDCSHRGDIVLDAFSGSGTTIIAAQKCGRRARAIEIDPLYVDVAIRRWQKLTGKQALMDVTGETFEEIAEQRSRAVKQTVDIREMADGRP